jgi:hypothetical protein
MTRRRYFAIENRVLSRDDKSYIVDVGRLHVYHCPPWAARVLSLCDGRTLDDIVEILDGRREEIVRQLDALAQLGLVSEDLIPAPGCIETDPLKVPISSLAIQVDDAGAERIVPLELTRQAFHLWMSHPARTPDLSLTLWVHCVAGGTSA